ncbi:MAG TPA: methyl-accepting chemotaxis protein [Gemmatimonadaceae bacterium]|jgi:methyl-accepting chemotaxis protein|nr:methyl-accepting chemotaxis protein [Gemmatimonadaceae bacterium]
MMHWYYNLRLRTKLITAFALVIGVMAVDTVLVSGAIAARDWTLARNMLWIGGVVTVLIAVGNYWLIGQSVAWPVQEIKSKMALVARGEVGVEVWITSHDEFGDLARGLEQIIASQKAIAGAASALAAGDVASPLQPRSDKDVTGNAVAHLQDTVRSLLDVMARLIASAKAGRLTERGSAAEYEGAWHDLVHGMNDTLDAIVRPLTEASTVLRRAASRDVTARMIETYAGDMAEFKTTLNTAVVNLDEALAQVSGAADQVAAASDQIRIGSESLAEGAGEQATAIATIFEELQELAIVTRTNAEHANAARGLNEAVGMRELSEAMQRIEASSSAIASIVHAMDDVATQTNVLALNAAIEAARAGEYGKGFAVVAQEVRSLSTRSAEAAQSTARLIEEARRHAEAGAAIASQVTGVMDEMAKASDRQLEGVEHIRVAMEQVNHATQNVAASSEESAAAAEELQSQAEEMRGLVNSFHLSGRDSRGSLAKAS